MVCPGFEGAGRMNYDALINSALLVVLFAVLALSIWAWTTV